MSREGDQASAGTATWHAEGTEALFEELDTGPEGLSRAEAKRRLETYGPNEIGEADGISPLAIFVSQFQDVLIYLLLFAALLSVGIGLLPGESPNLVDAALILVILLANGVFGFVQDYRAERSIEMLQDLSSPDATVIRDGEKRRIDATQVVPGDVLVLEQGDAIPADARLIEVTAMETMESALTGESTSVGKDPGVVDPETALAERHNMVYMDTNVVTGRGRAVVVGTGMDTQVGGIVTQIRSVEEGQTPFQEEVEALGRRIGLGIMGLIALVAAVQFLFTQAGAIPIVLTALTLAVAAVPEGLPAVVTLTLALGSRRMVARNALVRRLSVVESLGSIDVILTDKTGTLTENQMTVTRVGLGDSLYEVTGAGLDPEGDFRRLGGKDEIVDSGAEVQADQSQPVDPDPLGPVIRCGALCNNAELAPESANEAYFGDPTEIALLVSAAKAGIEPNATRVREIPFSSERKRMTVVVEDEEGAAAAASSQGDPGYTAYLKGAPRTVLERCDRILVDGTIQELTDERRAAVLETTADLAADALRVLGFATRSVEDPQADEAEIESGLVFLGLQGMIDPPREEVPRAVADCRDAGIRVVMATGDNLETAKAIGRSIGFDPEGALTGPEVAGLSDEALAEAVEGTDVFARMDPGQKVRVAEALQAQDHRVAMTGDGVNDAPGVRTADVGIAMGQRGTDVTQEASDMVLQDDNFVTIRDAIAEGRGIFDNIRKFVNYLLSANAGEVLVVFLGVIIGSALFPTRFAGASEALILTPVMLLWINLVTDGLPALALGADPKAADIMARPPRGDEEPVIDRRVLVSIGTIGVLMTVTGLGLFFYGLDVTGELLVAQTLLFTFLVVVEVLRIQLIRSRYRLSPFSNPWLVGAIASSLVLQLAVLYTPLAGFFDVVPLGLTEWSWIGVAFVAFVVLAVVAEVTISRVVGEY